MLRGPVSISLLSSVAIALVLATKPLDPVRAGGGDHSEIDLPRPLVNSDFLYEGAPPDALVDLGRTLFFDPILSGNRNISCGTCHDPARGTGDDLSLSIGEGGTGFGRDRRTHDGVVSRIPRNAQPLWNIGAKEYTAMFHDGRLEPDPAATFASGFWSPAREDLPVGLDSLLAAQAMFPVISHTEMAGQKGENAVATAVAEDRLQDAWDLLAARLAEIPGYVEMFTRAFADEHDALVPADTVTFVNAARALAAFQSVAFRSDASPFDRWLSGEADALDPEAKLGMQLFYGDAGCSGCHSGPLLTDHGFHAIAMPQIGPGKGHGEDTGYWRASGFMARLEDEGRYRVTFDADDLFAFRTPSLRNVSLTGPWGHDGAFGKLEDVVRHHFDPVTSLAECDVAGADLPPLDHVIEATGFGSELIFRPLNPARREAFALRDVWVQQSHALRARIAAANTLAPQSRSEAEVAALVAFLESLTDPSAIDRSDLVPMHVPSGLPPQPTPLRSNDHGG
ncbi:cytochrome c peroxidase [uncultured Roseobacter sp.]|uniref:cytochrome-c peroxidase n=1 Tax=uncultured Roseobacter sp. TaxID=114847 RepID=UPI002616B2FF|nr:cytochrome c peroxidase [uncultured Roseobacter sp.]